MEGLAAEAQSVQRMIGVKAGGGTVAQVPSVSRDADPEGWAALDKALGVPADGKYGEFKPETGNLLASAEQVGALDKAMHAAGATPAARDAALKAYHEMASAQEKALDDAWTKEVSEGNTKLKSEWGDKFDANLKIADRALEDHLGDDFVTLMKDSKLADHPILRATGWALAQKFAEGGPPPQGDTRETGGLTKHQAEQELDKLVKSEAFNRGDKAAEQRQVELLNIIHGYAS